MSRPKAGKEEPIHPVLSGKGATPLGPAPTSVEVGIPAQHAPDRQASPIPAIEPPKSWTTEDKQLFGSLSRVTQERIAQRERAGEADFGRTPNETVEKLKGLMGKERTGEHSTQHYEAALPLILNSLLQQQASQFPDVKTLADAERLARQDVKRYLRWDAVQKNVAEAASELAAAQHRQAEARLARFSAFAKREEELFKQKVPEAAAPEGAAALERRCLAALKDLGFEEAELAKSWTGLADFSLRDHRVQLLVRDAMLWREAQQKHEGVPAKSAHVERSGGAHLKGAGDEAGIQALSRQLDQTSGVNALRTAARLVAAKRAAAS